MKTTLALLLGLSIALLGGCDVGGDARAAAMAGTSDADMVVYKSPDCGCCDLWIDHVQEAGYSVAGVNITAYNDLVAVKAEHGVPMDLGSCHTARIGGYTVEGHVPAHVIQRLLAERPDIRGVAVPGMPIGSPGMEGPDPRPYQVFAIGHDGSRTVYQVVDPRQPNSSAR